MKKYIGVKMIEAEPMNLGEYNKYRGWQIPADEDPERKGYLVKYEDGYESWSPETVFDVAYRRIDNMTFGLAIEAMRKGYKVSRPFAAPIILSDGQFAQLTTHKDGLDRERYSFTGEEVLAQDWNIAE